MKETWRQPSIKEAVENFKKWPQSGINLDVLGEAIKKKELSPEALTDLNKTFVIGYNKALHACFPKDAFSILRGQNMIAEHIPAQEHLDLEREWEAISELTKLDIAQERITTEAVFKHFRQFKREDFRNYDFIFEKISLYISECLRRAHKERDPKLLERVIPTFKLLAYLHKLQELTHYSCESEFDAMVHFGVDPKKMEFRYLKKDEVREPFFDEATSVRN